MLPGAVRPPAGREPHRGEQRETLSTVPHILAEGPDWLRQQGTAASPGTMCFTVAGDVEREGVWELPMGTTLRALLEAAGGPRGEVKVIFPGASSTALLPAQLDTPLTFEHMAPAGSALGAGGFAVYDTCTCMAEAALVFCRFLHVESCAQCPPCKLNSGDVVEFLEAQERGDPRAALDQALVRARGATDGQKCALPTGTSLLVQSLFLSFEEVFRSDAGRACPSPRELVLPKIMDWDEQAGRFTYDEGYARKRLDWTYERTAGFQ